MSCSGSSSRHPQQRMLLFSSAPYHKRLIVRKMYKHTMHSMRAYMYIAHIYCTLYTHGRERAGLCISPMLPGKHTCWECNVTLDSRSTQFQHIHNVQSCISKHLSYQCFNWYSSLCTYMYVCTLDSVCVCVCVCIHACTCVWCVFELRH